MPKLKKKTVIQFQEKAQTDERMDVRTNRRIEGWKVPIL